MILSCHHAASHGEDFFFQTLQDRGVFGRIGQVLELVRIGLQIVQLVTWRPLIAGETEPEDALRCLREIAAQETLFSDGRRRKVSLTTLRRKWQTFQKMGFTTIKIHCRWTYDQTNALWLGDFEEGPRCCWRTRRFARTCRLSSMVTAWNQAHRKLREIDPHHLISFRQGNTLPHDFVFTGTPKHIDFICPEGYSIPHSEAGYLAAGFITKYVHYTTGGKPVVWSEFGQSVWDSQTMSPSPST